jgi:hypothetical protein
MLVESALDTLKLLFGIVTAVGVIVIVYPVLSSTGFSN